MGEVTENSQAPVVVTATPEEIKPSGELETVPKKDIDNLKSVYDKKLLTVEKEKSDLQGKLTDVQAELESLKVGVPSDVTAKVKAEVDLKKREAALKVQAEGLEKKGLTIKAKELLLEHGVQMDLAELIKLGSEVEIELAVLRQKTLPKREMTVPRQGSLDLGGGTGGGPVSENAMLLAAIEKAKKR